MDPPILPGNDLIDRAEYWPVQEHSPEGLPSKPCPHYFSQMDGQTTTLLSTPETTTPDTSPPATEGPLLRCRPLMHKI